MKEEALKLADSYEVRANFISEHHEKSGKLRMSTTNQATIKRHKKTADIIRRLVEELDRLVGAEPITHGKLTFCKNCGQQDSYAQTKPLSDDEIKEIADRVCYLIDKDKKDRLKGSMYIEDFARAIIKASRGEK